MSKVQLYVYDLSQGMAKLLSMQFVGKQIDGIWHTGVVVFGKEYFYSQGVNIIQPGSTHHGAPLKIIEIGETELTQDILEDFLLENQNDWSAEKYHLLDHNCNDFSNLICQFLVDKSIPESITSLPTDFLTSPLGKFILPKIENIFGKSKLAANQGIVGEESSNSPLLNLISPAINNLTQTIANKAKTNDNNAIILNQPSFNDKNHSHSKIPSPSTLFSYNKVLFSFNTSSNIIKVIDKSINLLKETKILELDNKINFLNEIKSTDENSMTEKEIVDIVINLYNISIDLIEIDELNKIFPLIDIIRILLTINYNKILKDINNSKMILNIHSNLLEKLDFSKLDFDLHKHSLLMILRLSTNFFTYDNLSKDIFNVNNKLSSGMIIRSLFTALLIESLLNNNIQIRQASASLLNNISIVIFNNRKEYSNEGSGKNNELIGYSIEWECEIVAAIGENIGHILEELKTFDYNNINDTNNQDYLDSVIRIFTSLGNILYFSPQDIIDLSLGISVNDNLLSIKNLILSFINDNKTITKDKKIQNIIKLCDEINTLL